MTEILVVGEGSAGSRICSVAHGIATQTGWRWARLRLSKSDTHAFAEAVAKCVQDAKIVLMGATAMGKDLMARVAEHLDVPLAQDCIGYRVAGSKVVFIRPLYGGKVLAEVHLAACPALATFRPRTQPAYQGAVAILEHVLTPSPHEMQVVWRKVGGGAALDVARADIVVSGGRGMQGPEHWHILESLAAALGPKAALACSRPVSDNGWRPRAEHVGQTGRVIAPAVYVAVGISGAVQHVAGIAGSKCIIAINKDPHASIFKVADYGIVGDLFEVVPALTAAVKALR